MKKYYAGSIIPNLSFLLLFEVIVIYSLSQDSLLGFSFTNLFLYLLFLITLFWAILHILWYRNSEPVFIVYSDKIWVRGFLSKREIHFEDVELLHKWADVQQRHEKTIGIAIKFHEKKFKKRISFWLIKGNRTELYKEIEWKFNQYKDKAPN